MTAFAAANCAIFWVLARYYHLIWIFPIFYVWVGIFGVLAPTQVWTLANYALTTREAKRIFGMVGGGAIGGAIFAGFFSKTVAKAFGTESLLLGMALLLLTCSLLMFLMWQTGQVQAGDAEEADAVFTMLMGDEVPPRKHFIQTNAITATLDI